MTSILFCVLTTFAMAAGAAISIVPGAHADDTESRYASLLGRLSQRSLADAKVTDHV